MKAAPTRKTAVADGSDTEPLSASRAEKGAIVASTATPALIKAYLRLGGCVGEGAWIDHDFNTTDVCLVMDTAKMSAKHRDFYIRKHGAAG